MNGLKIGVDEAGRGPVIGPLVVCAMCIPEGEEEVLHEIGARDSKELSPAERRSISEKILSEVESGGWRVGIVLCEAERIDSNRQSSDLNRLEVELFAEAIEAAAESGSRTPQSALPARCWHGPGIARCCRPSSACRPSRRREGSSPSAAGATDLT